MFTEEIFVACVNIVKKQSVIDPLLLPLEHIECFDNDLESQWPHEPGRYQGTPKQQGKAYTVTFNLPGSRWNTLTTTGHVFAL